MEVSSVADFFKTIPHALWESSLTMTAETMNGIMKISHRRDSVLNEKQTNVLKMCRELNWKRIYKQGIPLHPQMKTVGIENLPVFNMLL